MSHRYNNRSSPVPCEHGNNCYYHGFMGNDNQWVERICTRIHPMEPEQEYNQRMKLRCSWSDWCKRMGYPQPVRVYKPRVQPQQQYNKPVVQQQQYINKPLQKVINQIKQEPLLQKPVYQPVSVSKPVYVSQPVVEEPEEQIILSVDPEDDVKEEKMLQQSIGDSIYKQVEKCIENKEVKDLYKEMGWIAPTITVAKITGMILEACTASELCDTYKTPSILHNYIMECSETLQQVYHKKQLENPLSYENCGVLPGALWGDCMI